MDTSSERGKLYLVPTPISEESIDHIAESVREIVARAHHFIVETQRTGRRQVKALAPNKQLDSCTWAEWNKKTPPELLNGLLDPALRGEDICLLSDAGSPTIADPGAPVVSLAHRKGVPVMPLSGPSAILLALMASGFQGQRFAFHGYLPPQKGSRRQELKKLERSAYQGITQIFMETPYRNQQMLTSVLSTCQSDTMFCVACNLGSAQAFIRTQSIHVWKQTQLPDLHKKPCIFLLSNT
ncbi:MAG: SAM-dependent methyltransferase [Saprospiraceae bacterium]|nr:SAM-dependent methyltransferase [Saprospiraceae bacterium]